MKNLTNPWVFISKLKQGILTTLETILGSWKTLACSLLCVCAVWVSREEERMKDFVTCGNEIKKMSSILYVLLV